MSENIKSAKDILLLKKKKKELDFEASDFEFGFDDVPKKVFISDKPSKYIVVPYPNPHKVLKHGRIHRTKKNNQFTYANSLKRKKNKSDELLVVKSEKPKQTDCLFTVNQEAENIDSAQSVENPNVNALTEIIEIPGTNFISLPPIDIDCESTNDDTKHTLDFELNSNDDNDLMLIQKSHIEEDRSGSKSISKCREPILFRYNYFKIIEKKSDSYRAMCVCCGYDENNEPNTICTAKDNVSSNLITHLKVSQLCLFLISFVCRKI